MQNKHGLLVCWLQKQVVCTARETSARYILNEHIWQVSLIGRTQSFNDHTWGEVALLSGLPGTGKDTWIQKTTAIYL